RPSLRTKGKARAWRPAPSAPHSPAGPRLWAVRARVVSAAAPRRGRAAGLGRGRAVRRGESRRAATCPAPWLPKHAVSLGRCGAVGKGLLPSGVGLGGLSPEFFGSGRCCRPSLQRPGLPLPVSEGHALRWWWEGKFRAGMQSLE
ncbi:hypothetical protein Nmel_005873, partial [Mimus melanotis]